MSAMFEAMGAALGAIGAASWPDTVTFRRPINQKGSAGGNIVNATGNPTEPQAVPVLIRPASGSESIVEGKPVSGSAYILMVPNNFKSALIDVDATCLAQVAARTGGEEGRAYHIHRIDRYEGISIDLLCSLEE